MHYILLLVLGLISPPGLVLGLLLRQWIRGSSWDQRERSRGLGIAAVFGVLLLLFLRPYSLFSLWLYGLLLGPAMGLLLHSVGAKPKEEQTAQPSTASSIPAQVEGELVIGQRIMGDLAAFVRGQLAIFPAAMLRRGLLVIGFPGAGKTETLLRLAAGAAKVLQWQVIFVDCKGDRPTLERFYAVMQGAGLTNLHAFPDEPYNGFAGDPQAIKDRLKSVLDFSEPYYESIADLMLDLAIHAPGGPPRSAQELLGRLRREELARLYAGDQEALADIADIEGKDARGVYNRYRAFFGKMRGQLDGAWTFEDCEAAYFLVDGVSLQDSAIGLTRYLLQDFNNYAARRKEQHKQVLFIVDEFSAVERGTRIHDLIERLRGYGAATVIGSQSYAGLGEYADRIMDATPTKIVHQCDDPERLTQRAGEVEVLRRTREVQQDDAEPGLSGRMMVAEDREARVSPDSVRQLAPGECYIIHGGRSLKAKIARAEASAAQVEQARAQLEDQRIKTIPLSPLPDDEQVGGAAPAPEQASVPRPADDATMYAVSSVHAEADDSHLWNWADFSAPADDQADDQAAPIHQADDQAQPAPEQDEESDLFLPPRPKQ